jgi:hypothetical protein
MNHLHKKGNNCQTYGRNYKKKEKSAVVLKTIIQKEKMGHDKLSITGQ